MISKTRPKRVRSTKAQHGSSPTASTCSTPTSVSSSVSKAASDLTTPSSPSSPCKPCLLPPSSSAFPSNSSSSFSSSPCCASSRARVVRNCLFLGQLTTGLAALHYYTHAVQLLEAMDYCACSNNLDHQPPEEGGISFSSTSTTTTSTTRREPSNNTTTTTTRRARLDVVTAAPITKQVVAAAAAAAAPGVFIPTTSLSDQDINDYMSGALCSIAELFMTDLCNEDDARERCLATIHGALRRKPASIEAHCALAQYQKIIGNMSGAKAAANKCKHILKDAIGDRSGFPSVETRVSLCRTLLDLGEPVPAIQILKTCLLYDDEDVQAWYVLSCALLLSGQWEEAKAAGERAKQELSSAALPTTALLQMGDALEKLLAHISTKISCDTSQPILYQRR